jgi:hypothetical protein
MLLSVIRKVQKNLEGLEMNGLNQVLFHTDINLLGKNINAIMDNKFSYRPVKKLV